MSVDTYLKGKNTSRYQAMETQGVKILVSLNLTKWAKWVNVEQSRVPRMKKILEACVRWLL